MARFRGKILFFLALYPFHQVKSGADTSTEVCTRSMQWGVHDAQDYDACTLKMIYNEGSRKNFPALPKLKNGFQIHNQWDDAIQFWLGYWKKKGYQIPIRDPLLIKAMIAIESSFETGAESYHPESSAYGLMQVTNQTRRILTGIPNPNGWTEVHDHRIHVSRDDLTDGMVSIAVGIRWLGHKYENLPYKTQFHLLKWYHSWDAHGEDYARKVLALYESSKSPRKLNRLRRKWR